MSDSNALPTEAQAASESYRIVVLLVDDQPIVGEAIRRVLAGEPAIEFHYCQRAEEALAAAVRVRPTVILQDLVLPEVDGLTLLQRYRAEPRTAGVPVIVLSAKEEPAIKSEAFKQGADDYLVKLPDPVELMARIRHHSKAYIHQIQRDEAYRALHESQRKLMEMNAELQRLSSIDGLTGLSNRRYLDERLAAEWRRAKRERSTLSIIMVDVDEFKRYNDSCGHLAGDEVLKQVAAAMKACFVRPADLVARFGGEEFIGVLPGTLVGGAEHVAEHLRRGVELLQIPHRAATVSAYVSVSVGVASMSPQPSDSSDDLVRAADSALYEAKKRGRNQVWVAALDEAQARRPLTWTMRPGNG